MVAKGHKIANVPLFKKICDIMVPQKIIMSRIFLNSGTLIVIVSLSAKCNLLLLFQLQLQYKEENKDTNIFEPFGSCKDLP